MAKFHNPFRRRPRPEGKFKLAHPLREPVRAVGQSFVAWPAVAFAAMMYAAPQDGVEKPAIVLLFLQVTIVYPLIAGAAFLTWFLLARAGHERAAAIPLLLPLAITAVWALALVLFVLRYIASIVSAGFG